MKSASEIGMVGLGTMGLNLVLNIADHGFSVVGYDTDARKTDALKAQIEQRPIRCAMDVQDLVDLLRKPRAVMIMVPAGPPVDAVIDDLLPRLDKGDVIIDGGNSHFDDTNRRAAHTGEKGVGFLGVGISGGAHGARHGPSIMPGGPADAYARVQPIFEAIAAQFNDEACVHYLGPGSAGHYVKMVHNGIEYGLMRLTAEAYDLMKRGLGLTDDELAEVYEGWNEGELRSYLIEITARIFRLQDHLSRQRLIDLILDEAKQNGTGMWTSEDALKLQVPTPSIDIAVSMRFMSTLKAERESASAFYDLSLPEFREDRYQFLAQLRNATYAAMTIIYAQGMALLRQASRIHGYNLDLAAVARIWREGCIIRSQLVEEIRKAYEAEPTLVNVLLDPRLGSEMTARLDDLRSVVATAVTVGIPVPALAVSLAYFDAYRSKWMPANLIQAQRDYFGAHMYERADAPGLFHTEWEPK